MLKRSSSGQYMLPSLHDRVNSFSPSFPNTNSKLIDSYAISIVFFFILLFIYCNVCFDL